MAPDKGLIEELLGLATQCALHHHAQSATQLSSLFVRNAAVIALTAEEINKCGFGAEQCPGWLDVLNESPKLGERVLNRCRGEQKDR